MTHHVHQQEGQAVQQSRQTTQPMGMRFADVETLEERAVIEGVVQSINACGWCADQCVQLADKNMVECVRLCEDVTEIGEAALVLLSRRSRNTATVLQAFEQAAEACAVECSQHQHEHCQECVEALDYAIDSIQQYLGVGSQQMAQSLEQQPQQAEQMAQPMAQQGGQFEQPTTAQTEPLAKQTGRQGGQTAQAAGQQPQVSQQPQTAQQPQLQERGGLQQREPVGQQLNPQPSNSY